MPVNLTDVAFFVILPVLAVILIFALIVYLSRGRRRISLNLSGFGIRLSVDSAATDSSSEG